MPHKLGTAVSASELTNPIVIARVVHSVADTDLSAEGYAIALL